MDPLSKLEQRAESLGNHYLKYLNTIRHSIDTLTSSLDCCGKLAQVHLWHSTPALAEEMALIRTLPTDQQSKIKNLGCYYALQYLHMIFRNLDILELGLASGQESTEIYHRFMVQFGTDFRNLTKGFLSNLLDLYLTDSRQPEFFICSVGTRSDQDDIDVGLISAEQADVAALNSAFQKITQHMLVYATPLHMYLSEHVGTPRYSTTISEYKQLLDKQIQDVIIISELLNATLVYGNAELYQRFQRELVYRYFYSPEGDNRYHEGFLRGILGEARSILISPPQSDAISPKDDILRLLKLIIYAKRSLYNLHNAYAWENLIELETVEPTFKSEYEFLLKGLSFLEMFKFLMQLHVVQEETFRLKELDPSQLALIAEKMGYRPIGMVSAWEQLVIDYYHHVREGRRVAEILLEDITRHLGSISLITRLLTSDQNRDASGVYQGSLPQDFIATASFFSGTKYWEDVLQLIETNPRLLDDFIKGFEKLPDVQKNKTIQRFVQWSQYSAITLIRLITIIGKRQEHAIGTTLFKQMSLAFLQYIEQLPYTTERLCRIFSHYPHYIHDFLQHLPEEHFSYLERIIERPVLSDHLKIFQIQLRELCLIHKWSGQYFHRFFHQVISNHPEYLKFLTTPDQLAKIATGLLAMTEVYPDTDKKKKILGDYYDLEFLRIGIGTMRGIDLKTTNYEFTEFCDTYIHELFYVCSQEINGFEHAELSGKEHLAILAAGGHGRKQAYDDDYDLIAVLVDENPDLARWATRILTHMNREIVRRGLLPHYRLGEILGGYVNTLETIIRYLSSEQEESFIDLSQFLGARIIIGTPEVQNMINRKILEPFVFKRKALYINRMIQEIYNRQNIDEFCRDISCSLKESKGGLRDIEAIALMLKAYLGKTEPLSENFFSEIKLNFRPIEHELETLSGSGYFLRFIRNLYRLLVSAEDRIQSEHLYRLAVIFQRSGHPELGSAELIMKQVQDTLARSAIAGALIINYLRSLIN